MSYVIEAGSYAGGSNLVPGYATNSVATTFVASAPPGTYMVRLRALYGSQLSEASNEVTIAVGTRGCADSPPPPAAIRFSVSTSLLTLSWDEAAADVTSYFLAAGSARGLINLGSVETGTNATTFAAHIPHGRYYISVRGRNACGLGPPAEVMIDVP